MPSGLAAEVSGWPVSISATVPTGDVRFGNQIRWGCVLVVGVLSVVAASGASASGPQVRLDRRRVQRARSFWTSARMRQARPVEGPPPGPESGAEPLAGSAESSALVPDPTAPGIRENGAVFISEGPDRGFARCSGTSVSAPSMSVVFTAGHCVFDEGRWSARHWVFVPAYRYGERPFGTFAARWLGTTPGWLKSGNDNYDVGAAVVSRNERGETLGAAVGAYKVAFGLSPRQLFDVYGYPVARPFDGSSLRVCAGASYLGHDLEAWLTPGPLELGVSCKVSGGSSGGGWVIDGDTLDGVTSNSYPDDPTTVYGPYFGHAVAQLYARAARVR